MAPRQKPRKNKRKIRAKKHKTQLKRNGTVCKKLVAPGKSQGTPIKLRKLNNKKRQSHSPKMHQTHVDSSDSDSGPTSSKKPNNRESFFESDITVNNYSIRSWSTVLVPNRRSDWSQELDDSSSTDEYVFQSSHENNYNDDLSDTWEIISEEEDSDSEYKNESLNRIIETQVQLSETFSKIITRLDAIEHNLKTLSSEELKKGDSPRLTVLMDGLPESIKGDYVVKDLRNKGFDPIKTARVKENKNSPSKLISFELPGSQDHIFYLSCCLGFPVTITKRFMSFDPAFLGPNDSFVEPNQSPFEVLIRIPVGVPERLIEKDLNKKMFTPLAVFRLMKPSFSMKNLPMQYMYVEVPQEQNYILELKCLLGMPVNVIEYVEKHWTVMRCSSCRRFGHLTKFCRKEIEAESAASTNYAIIMIEGIPCEYETGEVKKYMEDCGYTAIAIHRMVEEHETLPSCLVKLPANQIERSLLIDCVLGFNVKVETFRRVTYPIKECPKCEAFIHNSCNCESNIPTENDSKVKDAPSSILEQGIELSIEAKDEMIRFIMDMGQIDGPWDKLLSNLSTKEVISKNMKTMLDQYKENLKTCINLMSSSDERFYGSSHNLNELLHLEEKLEAVKNMPPKPWNTSSFPHLEVKVVDD